MLSCFSGFRLSSLITPVQRLWGRSALIGGLVIGGITLVSSPTLAAESITVQLGPFSQTVSLDDLQVFATTGDVPGSLRLYRPLLNARLQETLQGEITLDPEVGQVILDEILHTPGGRSCWILYGQSYPI
jgi:hypothetical protein